jgi:hypothetical protein
MFLFHCVRYTLNGSIISIMDTRVNLFNCRFERRSSRSGQAMVEYAIVAGMLVTVWFILVLFLRIFGEYGARILDMVAADYP